LNSTLRTFGSVLLFVLGPMGLIPTPNASAELVDVDLELILAVDVSPSMSVAEQKLQRDGYVQAFRHPDITRAIESGFLGKIAVAYFEWAGAHHQHVVVPWTILEHGVDAYAFSEALAAAPLNADPATSISGSLLLAKEIFAASPARSMRRVIDISGDGKNNAGPQVAPIRDSVLADGIIINGLPIILPASDAPDNFNSFSGDSLESYFEHCVIGGPGAFLIGVSDLSTIAIAIRRKLVLEIAGLSPRLIFASHDAKEPSFDCLSIGDRPGR